MVGRYGTDYIARAATARIAIGANPPEDAVYMSSSADGSGQAGDPRWELASARTGTHALKSNELPDWGNWGIPLTVAAVRLRTTAD